MTKNPVNYWYQKYLLEKQKNEQIIDKACEFIDKKANFYRYHYVGEEHECDMVDTRKFTEDFKKAMEEWL